MAGAQVRSEPQDSATRVVAQLWLWGQQGAVVPMLSLYDRRLTTTVGTRIMIQAFLANRSAFAGRIPTDFSEEATLSGELVTVYLRDAFGKDSLESFLALRGSEDRVWRIIGDSMTEAGILVQGRFLSSAPRGRREDEAQVAKLTRAASRFRLFAVTTGQSPGNRGTSTTAEAPPTSTVKSTAKAGPTTTSDTTTAGGRTSTGR